VRLAGQDAERGTFSHRHANWHDYETGDTYMPLRHLAPDQARLQIINSPLSETGVLGFEYGYSLDTPDGLVAWEAQFGDFWNVAQPIVDQFIASAEDKWQRLSGLVMLLPHGFEGMGPEHSSARPERFLLMAADYNIQVCQPSTPAQHFHLLRRQVLRKWRKPLVVLTPKSMLRNAVSFSPLEELAEGEFHWILPDPRGAAVYGAKRILLCAGKLYYELEERRRELHRDDVAIIRVEQLHPFPVEQLQRELERFPAEAQVFWVQEEPENMGAWRYLVSMYPRELFGRWSLDGVYRMASASPATGSAASHRLEQDRLLTAALGGP
jgi:2-oxoglutarate dehydrogenase E1 component